MSTNMRKLNITPSTDENLPPRPKKQRTTRDTAIAAFRGAQIILALLILTLSATLLSRWLTLQRACGPDHDAYDEACNKTAQGTGGLKYCVFVGVWALFDFSLWAVDTFIPAVNLPTIVIIFGSQFTGGFALGGGCTLAALINGWKCEAGPDGSLRLCNQLYADIAFFFLLVIVAWTNVGCLWNVKKNGRCPPRADSRMS